MGPGLGFLPRANISRPDYYYFHHAAERPAAPSRSSPVVLGKWPSTVSPGKPLLPWAWPMWGETDPRAGVGSFSWALSPYTS